MMSMPQSFSPHHAGMTSHPGVPHGHHMGAGQPPNPGQPGPGQPPGQAMPQQMHVSGPGMLQGTQGAPVMGAMSAVATGQIPGGPVGPGPSAHAMSHLNPGQAQQMFQAHQQQQQMAQALVATNPQLQQQYHQQQQIIRQRQALLQSHHNHGMPIALPNGVNPGLNAAQFAAMQANPNMRPVNLPHHMQQQQLAAQAAAAQQQQQQQQQQHHQQQHQLLAQQLAMQQQASAAAQAGAQAQQGPMGSQQQIQNLQNSQAAAAAAHQQQQQQQHHAAQQQHHAAAAAAMMQPRMQNPLKGTFVLQMLQFGDHLSQSADTNQQDDLHYWQRFVDQFFSQGGVLRQQLLCPSDQLSKQYEISTPALPRFYYTHFESGVRRIQMILENAREKELPNNCHYVESQKASFTYWFDNGNHLISSGTLRAQFDQNSKIDVLEFVTTGHEEYLSRPHLKSLFSPDNSPNGQSPKQLKNGKQSKAQQRSASQPVTLPPPQVNSFGVTDAVMRFLELAETISQMQTLFQFSQQHSQLGPFDALDQLVANFHASSATNQQLVGPAAGMNLAKGAVAQAQMMAHPPGVRTPGVMPNNVAAAGQQFPFSASPAATHLGLPGSPHIGSQPSPAQSSNTMQAPSLVAQHSQQGTNSSQGTSANTSPNVPNKRRRPSGVKVDVDDGGAGGAAVPGAQVEVNGTNASKVKPSPRIGGKRQKGTQG